MKKRKYLNFIFESYDNEEAVKDGNNFFECRDWRAAFSSFMRGESCAIWGLPNKPDASYEVILYKTASDDNM